MIATLRTRGAKGQQTDKQMDCLDRVLRIRRRTCKTSVCSRLDRPDRMEKNPSFRLVRIPRKNGGSATGLKWVAHCTTIPSIFCQPVSRLDIFCPAILQGLQWAVSGSRSGSTAYRPSKYSDYYSDDRPAARECDEEAASGNES